MNHVSFICCCDIVCIIMVTLTHWHRDKNGRRFADDIFKSILLKENVSIAIKISLKFVPKGPINNIPTLVQIMAWRRPGDKPLSEPMMVSLPKHICVTRLGPNELKTTSHWNIGDNHITYTPRRSVIMQEYARSNRIYRLWISGNQDLGSCQGNGNIKQIRVMNIKPISTA